MVLEVGTRVKNNGGTGDSNDEQEDLASVVEYLLSRLQLSERYKDIATGYKKELKEGSQSTQIRKQVINMLQKPLV